MAGLFPDRGDFSIPNELIDDYQWVTDAFIDDANIGVDCKLYFHQISTECPNCHQDKFSGRSSGIYKAGGPIVFENYTICPYCNGDGKSITQHTESIRLRIYWEEKHWIKGALTIEFDNPTGVVQIIGYLKDMPRIQKCEKIEINYLNDSGYNWFFEKLSEPKPHGFRKNRYFIQFLRRIGS